MGSKEIEASLAAGVIVNVGPSSPYLQCVVCPKNGLTDLGAHLLGKEHKNSLIWEAVRDPRPSEYLLGILPQVVRAAKSEDEVEAVDKNHFSYKCKICRNKKAISGMAPLESHLRSKDHEKAKKVLQCITSSPHKQIPVLSSMVTTPDTAALTTVPSSGGDLGQLQGYMQQLRILDSAASRNQVSKPAQSLDASSTPQFPVRAQSNYDIKQTQTSQLNAGRQCMAPPDPFRLPFHQPAPVAEKPFSVVSSTAQPSTSLAALHDANGGLPMQPSYSLSMQACSSLKTREASDFPVTDLLTPEAKRAIDSRVVAVGEKSKSGTSFFCNICKVSLTGAIPLKQHIEGEKHKKAQTVQLREGLPFPLPDSHRVQTPPTLSHGESTLISLDSKRIQSLPLARQRDQVDELLPYPWDVRPCASPKKPSTDIYKNLSIPRGLVSIFNYHFSGESRRLGAKMDSHNLNALFTKMGYHVKTYTDLTREGTLEELERIRSDPYLDACDSFIMIILSHGKNDSIFYTNDQEYYQEMDLEDVRYHFVDDSCPRLKNKPKIFLVNFCRGEIEEAHCSVPDRLQGRRGKAPQDMLTVYASIKNFKAMRHQEKGTIFVQALCKVLAEHAHDTDLVRLCTILGRTMKEMGGTTPEQQIYNFKQFFFNPIPYNGL